jgi:hypothetical protein
MVLPVPESWSQYLSNEYSTNLMGFEWSRKITNVFGILILVTKVDLRP